MQELSLKLLPEAVPLCRHMPHNANAVGETEGYGEGGNAEEGTGRRGEEPVACDPIFAPINKFNAQTPGMREHIKNENYILPRSYQAHTHTTHTNVCICTYASQGKSTLCVCVSITFA